MGGNHNEMATSICAIRMELLHGRFHEKMDHERNRVLSLTHYQVYTMRTGELSRKWKEEKNMKRKIDVVFWQSAQRGAKDTLEKS